MTNTQKGSEVVSNGKHSEAENGKYPQSSEEVVTNGKHLPSLEELVTNGKHLPSSEVVISNGTNHKQGSDVMTVSSFDGKVIDLDKKFVNSLGTPEGGYWNLDALFYVKQSEIHGFGVFAKRGIPKGTIWWKPESHNCTFVGEHHFKNISQLGGDMYKILVRFGYCDVRHNRIILLLDSSRFFKS